MSIGFIGCGNMATAIIKGITESGVISSNEIYAYDPAEICIKNAVSKYSINSCSSAIEVVKLCEYYCTAYPLLNKDLLISAAICHDIGKIREISLFPQNDYTDEGQFLGHIVIGTEMVAEKINKIEGFPVLLASELKHCILAHHGEYEFGSPKKPAIMEAVALNFADNTDAKLQTFTEILENSTETGWMGFNRLFESNLRGTRLE